MLHHANIFLRRLHASDANTLAQLANNKKIWDNMRDYLPHPYGISDAVLFIGITQQEEPQVSFAIEYDGVFCGVAGLVPQSDVYKRTAEIGYWLGEPYWGKGIATAAVKLVTDYGFNVLDLLRIHTGVFEYNIGSMNVLLKNGYTLDGIFRKSIFKNGKVYDEHRFSKVL